MSRNLNLIAMFSVVLAGNCVAELELDAPVAHAGDPRAPHARTVMVDFDGDGFWDLVGDRYPWASDATDDMTNYVTVWHGRAGGPDRKYFCDPVNLPAPVWGCLLGAGDLDGDGDADFVAAGRVLPQASMDFYRNDGGWPALSLGGSLDLPPGQAYSLALVDVDGYQAQEVVMLASVSGTMYVLVYARDPSKDWAWQEVWRQYIGGDYWEMTPADVDGDGRRDLLLLSFDNKLMFLRGTGELGSPFVIDSEGPTIDSPLTLAAADLDGDGREDVAVGRPGGQIGVYRAADVQQPGEFPLEQVASLTITPYLEKVLLADATGDGIVDVVATVSAYLCVCAGEGTPASPSLTFAGEQRYVIGNYDSSPHLVDVNDDGLLDLVQGTHWCDYMGVLEQVPSDAGPGFWQPRLQATPFPCSNAKTCDFDADGRMDLLIYASSELGSEAGRGVVLLMARRPPTDPDPYEETWRETGVQPLVGPRGIEPLIYGDFNGDGRLDFMDQTSTAYLFDPAAGPGFVKCLNPDIIVYAPALAADVDGDGVLDLISASTGPFRVFRGLTEGGVGTGHFALLSEGLSIGAESIFCGRIDGDSLPDLILPGQSYNPGLHILLNDPTTPGSFLAGPTLQVPLEAHSAILVDANENGLADLICTYNHDRIARIQALADLTVLPGGAASYQLTTIAEAAACANPRLRDMDGDGKRDLVLDGLGTVMILRGLGGLAFASPQRWVAPDIGESVLFDAFGDSLPDVVYGGFVTRGLFFLQNLSTSTSTPVLLSNVRMDEVPAGLEICCSLEPPAEGVRVHRALPDGSGWEVLTPEPVLAGPGRMTCFVDEMPEGTAPVASEAGPAGVQGGSEVTYRLEVIGSGGTFGWYGPYTHRLSSLPSGGKLTLSCTNPLHASSRIAYTTGRSAPARLRIYDLRGKLVREISAGFLAAGRHEAAWDGLDAAGRRVASGLYFVRFEQTGRSAIKKVTVVR